MDRHDLYGSYRGIPEEVQRAFYMSGEFKKQG
jgi:hypothetical protein